MITIFQKFKTFWSTFWNSIKEAYNKAFKHPVKINTQEYRDTNNINFLAIFASKLNNLCNTEATFEVESDSAQAERLKYLAKDLESKRYDITAGMLADGDYYVFPATNAKGEIVHSYLSQEQVRIIDMSGDEYREVEGIIDWYVDKNDRVYFLVRNHRLEDNGTLTISYRVVDDQNKPATVAQWEYLANTSTGFVNANHIGIGRYKSPASSRGLSPVYGVPLNFGCQKIEGTIFEDLELIRKEFKNGESKIFADPEILRKNENRREYEIPENVFPVRTRAGQPGPNIDIFNPTLRYSEHYSKLVGDLALYEKQVGTSKGILTDNETTENATATAVKRANADTIALLSKLHSAIDSGNEMTLSADAVFLNVAPDLWSYKSDWYDPFEDPAEQFSRLNIAIDKGYAEKTDGMKWLFPSLSEDEIEEKLSRISAETESNTESALERMLGGA